MSNKIEFGSCPLDEIDDDAIEQHSKSGCDFGPVTVRGNARHLAS
jgi:hypothetical protein